MTAQQTGQQPDARGPDWPEVVKMALQQGQANMAERVGALRWLQQEASTTLTLCLAGMAGALAYAAPWLTTPANAEPLARGAAWACGYLALLAVLLVFGCLLARAVPPQANEPKNLLDVQAIGIVDLQWSEALALQVRIDRMRAAVERTARWLNAPRAAAAALPLVFLAAATWPWR